MTCPNCRGILSERATSCECGYDFDLCRVAHQGSESWANESWQRNRAIWSGVAVAVFLATHAVLFFRFTDGERGFGLFVTGILFFVIPLGMAVTFGITYAALGHVRNDGPAAAIAVMFAVIAAVLLEVIITRW